MPVKELTRILIYEDPITETQLEGRAVLIQFLYDGVDNLQRWRVCFPGEQPVDRWIQSEKVGAALRR